MDQMLVAGMERLEFAFVLITIPFYSLILFVIGRSCLRKGGINGADHLNTPFFKLMFCTGIVDIVTLLNNYLGSVFPKWGWFSCLYLNPVLESALARVYIGLAWGTGLAHIICVFVVALNRMICILTLFRSSKLWTENVTRLCCALQILPGLAIFLMILKDPIHFVLQPDQIAIVALDHDTEASVLYYKLGAACTAIGLFLTGATYAISFATLNHYKKKLFSTDTLRTNETTSISRGQRNSQLRSQSPDLLAAPTHSQRELVINSSVGPQRADEIRLFIASLIICAVELALAFVLVLHSFVQGPIWIGIYNLLCNIFSGINPYLLWAFSEPIRQKTCQIVLGTGTIGEWIFLRKSAIGPCKGNQVPKITISQCQASELPIFSTTRY